MPYVADPATLETGAAFSDLLNELYARGYDHLAQNAASVTRARRFINQANAEVELAEHWPFRKLTVQGVAPLQITDVQDIDTVVDTGNADSELDWMSERELTVYDLTRTGTPAWWWRSNLQVNVYPVAATTIEVRYWATPVLLVSDADTTRVPLRFMDAIVDSAVRRAAKDRDNPTAVALAQQELDRSLNLMRVTLLDMPRHQARVPYGSVDG